MINVYDIILNLLDSNRVYESFEWSKKDNIEHIKKIPMVRVTTNTLYDIINSTFLVDKSFLNEIYKKSEVYTDIGTSKIDYSVLFTDTYKVVAVEFNKEGKEILRNISNEYRIPENTEEDTEEKATENVEENTEESKEVTIKIDGEKVLSTQFEKEITNGSIQLSVGGATTSQAELQTYAKEAGYVEKILNNGALPVEYEVTANRYVKSNITADTYSIGIIVLTVIVLGAMIYLIVRYKKNGLLSSIAYIGYIAVLLLVIRYTNVIITIEGIFGLIISLAIDPAVI